MDKILILDYGSQYTQLIGRRVRELGVYSEIIPGDADIGPSGPHPRALEGCVGIILGGSPHSAYEPGAPRPHASVFAAGLPLLGVCYGIQRMTLDEGGRVERLHEREYEALKEIAKCLGLPVTAVDNKLALYTIKR